LKVLERDEHRYDAFARQHGKKVSSALGISMGAALHTRRVGGLGTKPECAVKSIDRFLTSLLRIQVDIKDQGKLPLAELPPNAEPAAVAEVGKRDLRRLRSAWRTKGWEVGKGFGQGTAWADGMAGIGGRNKAGMHREINR
jgi:hypothetical protein